jgi:hypothetical protein
MRNKTATCMLDVFPNVNPWPPRAFRGASCPQGAVHEDRPAAPDRHCSDPAIGP